MLIFVIHRALFSLCFTNGRVENTIYSEQVVISDHLMNLLLGLLQVFLVFTFGLAGRSHDKSCYSNTLRPQDSRFIFFLPFKASLKRQIVFNGGPWSLWLHWFKVNMARLPSVSAKRTFRYISHPLAATRLVFPRQFYMVIIDHIC